MKINVMVTPDRGYPMYWQCNIHFSHQKITDLLGEPKQEESDKWCFRPQKSVHSKDTDKYIDLEEFGSQGHYHLDINGTPLRIDLVNRDGKEMVAVFGTGTTDYVDFIKLLVAKYGEIAFKDWEE